MRQVSKKQARKNAEITRIKKTLPVKCHLCPNRRNDMAHLIPKATFPQYYTEEWNLVQMCRSCHNKYDNNKAFRVEQTELFQRVMANVDEEDKGRVKRYFGKI